MITQFKNLSLPRKIIIIVVSLLLIVGIAFGIYILIPKGHTFSEIKKIEDTIADDRLELKVTDIIITDKLNDIKAEEGSTFVCVAYEYKNISEEAVEWESFPLFTLGVYESDDIKKSPSQVFGNSEINKDALKQFSYIMGIDLHDALKPVEKKKTRYDAEVYQVMESDLENKSLFITFDIFDIGIKVEEGLSKLPNLKDMLKENKKKIEEKQDQHGITDADSSN